MRIDVDTLFERAAKLGVVLEPYLWIWQDDGPLYCCPITLEAIEKIGLQSVREAMRDEFLGLGASMRLAAGFDEHDRYAIGFQHAFDGLSSIDHDDRYREGFVDGEAAAALYWRVIEDGATE